MEFTLPLPAKLGKTNIVKEMWDQFSHRFHTHHTESNSTTTMPNTSIPSFLLFAARHKVDQISIDLKERGISQSVTNHVLQAVESVCLPYFLLLFERFQFFTLSQKSSQSASGFAERLRQQAELCQFSDVRARETFLIKTFISGIADAKVRKKLLKLQESNISLDDALIVCESAGDDKQAVDSAKPVASTAPATRKTRGRKRKNELGVQPSLEKKLFITLVDNDDHGDVDLDDANHIIDTLNTVSPSKKNKLRSTKASSTSKLRKRPKVFKCFACSHEYCTRKSFRRHVKAKHADIQNFYCVHCNLKFETRRECLTHCHGHRQSSTTQAFICKTSTIKPIEIISCIYWLIF
ncbi:gamma-glutamyl phosphate reductase [Elysia marginata]|uniref:Gamma-glutamyl phosphate reductase n=1 Tax=Elysia marginata TaxID=1093978 RepID=A0AAV4GJA9_9GAST|nr:gamma-glutamyl phosphate reductase [Elysia marginata]